MLYVVPCTRHGTQMTAFHSATHVFAVSQRRLSALAELFDLDRLAPINLAAEDN